MIEKPLAQDTQVRPKRKRPLRTPVGARNRVIAKKLLGKSNRQIAREEGMDHHTVGRVIEDSEFKEVIKSHRQEILSLVPKSLQLYMKAVRAALGEEDAPETLVPSQEKIQVLDREQVKALVDAAFRRGVAMGLDGMKAATETLKGTQAFVPKEEQEVTLKDDLSDKSGDELAAELAEMER